MIERGILLNGVVIPGTESVQRSGDGWFDTKADAADLRRRPKGDVTLGVLHWSGGPFRVGEIAATALVDAMKGRQRADGSPMSVSCHFLVDAAGNPWQTADLGVATIHAGSAANPRSIGIEVAHPGTGTNAAAIAKTLRARGRPVHVAYEAKPVTRPARGAAIRVQPAPDAQTAGVVALCELLVSLPAETGIVIPRQLALTGPPARRRGFCEHQHLPGTKLDAAGLFVDALRVAGWR